MGFTININLALHSVDRVDSVGITFILEVLPLKGIWETSRVKNKDMKRKKQMNREKVKKQKIHLKALIQAAIARFGLLSSQVAMQVFK